MARTTNPVGRPPEGDRAMTAAERQARATARKRQMGLVAVKVFIPASRVEDLRAIVAKWQEEAKRESPNPL